MKFSPNRAILAFLVACLSWPALAHIVRDENDFVESSAASSTLRPTPPDPEGIPRDGETQDDVDRRLGPWLELKTGGIAVGDPQGKVVTNPDGTTKGSYGSLVNATPLPERGEGFKRVGRQTNNWGTGFMISLLTNSSKAITDIYREDVIHIGGIAQEFGGPYAPHQSHQNGLDADVLFVGRTTWDSVLDENGKVTEKFQREKNWELWRMITSQKFVQFGKVDSIVSMILVAPEIKTHLCEWANATDALKDPLNFEVMRRIRPTAGHDDHFHIRLQCSPYHLDCKKGYSPPKLSGC